MKLINKINKFLGEEEVFDASAGMESLRKIVAKGETGWLGWREGKVEVSPIAANFLLKVYDMLGLEKKPAFVDKFKTKRGFMNLYLVSRGVALGESTFAEAYNQITEAMVKCPKCGKPCKENTEGNPKYCQGHGMGEDVFRDHQMKIALKTMKMNDVMASVMGGMSKDEARAFLKKQGWSDADIKKLEEDEESY